MERVRFAMRAESAGSRARPVFFRHPAARHEGMPWHGLVRRRGFHFPRSRPLAQGKRARTGFWPGGRGHTREVGARNFRQGKFPLSGSRTKYRQQAHRGKSSRRNHRNVRESKIRIRRLQDSFLRIATVSVLLTRGRYAYRISETAHGLGHPGPAYTLDVEGHAGR